MEDGQNGVTISTDDTTSILTIQSFNPYKHVGEIVVSGKMQKLHD